jgi:hypothetical protein
VSTSERLALLALVVSFASASFTLLQWRESHNQLLLSMKPSIDFIWETDPDELPVSVAIGNAGPGIAVIRSITWFVDQKPLGSVREVVDSAHLNNPKNVQWEELDENESLAVGEKQWLLRYVKNRTELKKPRTTWMPIFSMNILHFM